jgi:hypothetical protein
MLDRDIPECPVRIASTGTKLNEDENPTNLWKLLAFVKVFRKQDFWLELAIWDRIYYKNVNQHRQSHYFKKFGEVAYNIIFYDCIYVSWTANGDIDLLWLWKCNFRCAD